MQFSAKHLFTITFPAACRAAVVIPRNGRDCESIARKESHFREDGGLHGLNFSGD